MAKKKSFGASPDEHYRRTQVTLQDFRRNVKNTRDSLRNGHCKDAFDFFNAVTEAKSLYGINRWDAMDTGYMRSNQVKGSDRIVRSLKNTFRAKCLIKTKR